ncbi:putative LLM family oxidoreductase [Pedobacter sp. CAN_A7]|uniref:LLM class flavin-dependent oxidoreductase n=1 Tax=Pedobacter sp. CAN_A7 TaxID=2787722 RepID=UPI0018CA17BB
MELGIMTFADMKPESQTGNGVHGAQRLKDLLEEIQLADQLGLDIFGLGEHHRADYAVSAPAVVLGAAAALTKNIKLSSAVTVLSSDDPIRVQQQFATIDLLSEGRAEIMAGRGSFIESFPLFGYQLSQYDELFTKKLALLLRLQKNEVPGVYPHPYQSEMPVWLAAGGTPASAVRAATLGIPLMLAIIGGYPAQFVPFVNLYRETAVSLGRDVNTLQIGVNNHVYIGVDAQRAADEFFPYYAAMMNQVGKDRGWPPLTRQQFEQSRSQQGALMVGSVQQVIDKILYEHELFGNTRFLAQGSLGQVPHHMTMKSIELFGTQVAPAVRKALQ